jgi:hypothetical protein
MNIRKIGAELVKVTYHLSINYQLGMRGAMLGASLSMLLSNATQKEHLESLR